MIKLINQLCWRTVNSVLPERCCLCLQPDSGGFCHRCQDILPWIHSSCQRCGKAMTIPGICGQCQNKNIYFDQVVVPFQYKEPVSRHLHQLKYQGQFSIAPSMAKILAAKIIKSGCAFPDVLIPVPLHPNRLRQRGFNQASLIAQHVGKLLGLPLDRQLVSRIRDTPSQTELNAVEREKNMQDAFAVSPGGRYDSVAVIDDIITSGATINAICGKLRDQNYNQISAWAIAKT